MQITVVALAGDGQTLVAPHGELGIDTVQRLQTVLHGLIDQTSQRIVVDLGGLVFCDSIGLSTFVDGHHRCVAAGGYLRLAAPRPFLLRVLAVLGLLDQVPVYDTVQAACAGDPAGLSTAARQVPDPARRPPPGTHR